MNNQLNRFIIAQESSYEDAWNELKNGKKTTHWMWYTFPQIKGLGKTETAKKYEIVNREEAFDYLNNEILSQRLLCLTEVLVNDIHDKSAEDIFGYPDFLKLHSCLTLFDFVVKKNIHLLSEPKYRVFENALIKYYDGKRDQLTLNILEIK